MQLTGSRKALFKIIKMKIFLSTIYRQYRFFAANLLNLPLWTRLILYAIHTCNYNSESCSPFFSKMMNPGLQLSHSLLMGMVMKPVRSLCYMFLYTWRCTRFNSIPNILIILTDKNVALIYSVTICQKKTKLCAQSESFQHKLWESLFS